MVKNKQMENAKAAAAALCVFKRPPPTILRHVVALSLIKRTLSCRLCPFKGNSSATLPLNPATDSFLLVCHKLFLNAYLCGILPRAAATTFHNFYLLPHFHGILLGAFVAVFKTPDYLFF